MSDTDPDALAEAASLLLRHRLFPRAMAWNVQRQNSSPSTEQLVAAAAQVLEQQQSESLRRVDTLDVARSFPLLQAPQSSTTDEQQFRHALDAQSRNPRVSEPSTSRASGANVDQEREKLFRAMGKFLDPTSAAEGHRDPIVQEGYAQQTPAYYQEPIRRQYGGMPSPDRMTAEQQAAFQAMKISSYAEEERKSWAPQPQYEIVQDTAPSSLPSPTLGVQQIRLRSPPRDNVASGKKRTRGSTPVASTSAPVTSTKEDAIAPSLARALLTGCGAKQCSYEGCKKIAVSKGRCRGHGGGRRCQHAGCTKCAQSRSPFCWAHGGGKRCEAPNCRRSRKTKRFCVDHVEMELTVPIKTTDCDNVAKPNATKTSTKSSTKGTAGKGKKASGSYTSADSDDSIGRQSTISCDSSYSTVYNKENRRMHSTEYVQYQQSAGEMSGVPPQSLQLPSLNEALLRTVPTQYSAEATCVSSTTATPSPPAPLSSKYTNEYHSWPRPSQ